MEDAFVLLLIVSSVSTANIDLVQVHRDLEIGLLGT